jgi:hypothetical protein
MLLTDHIGRQKADRARSEQIERETGTIHLTRRMKWVARGVVHDGGIMVPLQPLSGIRASPVVTQRGSPITLKRAGHHLAWSFLFIDSPSGGVLGKPVPAITSPTVPKRRGDGHCHMENMVWM